MQQITDTILMVRPRHFGYDPETASNNAFQVNDTSLSVSEIEEKAREEFDRFVNVLRTAGINIIQIEDTDSPRKPDAVFPNNWFTTHQNGSLITYPLCPPNRRTERREDIISLLIDNYNLRKHIKLDHLEKRGLFLEGTGSMIFDRINQVVYACRSARTDESVLDDFIDITGYEPHMFYATDENNFPIYHTNVMMAVGETFVVIVLDTIRSLLEREELLASFDYTKKEVIELSMEQMMSFAGNMLQVKNDVGETFLVMSSQAYNSLRPEQIEQIKKHTNILHSPIPTIEKYGGGSARCMMAEIFLPKLKGESPLAAAKNQSSITS